MVIGALVNVRIMMITDCCYLSSSISLAMAIGMFFLSKILKNIYYHMISYYLITFTHFVLLSCFSFPFTLSDYLNQFFFGKEGFFFFIMENYKLDLL